ncbi:hypothetical protein CLV92_11178 [Kineococcus xinjiangensis]|uniref:TrbC/VIRB2 family protein n=1 Tax=Kineococcus xinjiangensis TaxID=512762 RepID=A0A2S6IG28_9ACTN|nr:pilin [Kineococcus xinjiangensis]PPK93161.1 hypothetical protein CLV92_11178 [Kineococcus xinjiangensis]
MMLAQLVMDAQATITPMIDPVALGTMAQPQTAEPPGIAGFKNILSWAMWIALSVCVLGIMVTGAMMAIASRDGRGGEHGARLLWVLVGCVVIGSASGFVNVLV